MEATVCNLYHVHVVVDLACGKETLQKGLKIKEASKATFAESLFLSHETRLKPKLRTINNRINLEAIRVTRSDCSLALFYMPDCLYPLKSLPAGEKGMCNYLNTKEFLSVPNMSFSLQCKFY